MTFLSALKFDIHDFVFGAKALQISKCVAVLLVYWYLTICQALSKIATLKLHWPLMLMKGFAYSIGDICRDVSDSDATLFIGVF